MEFVFLYCLSDVKINKVGGSLERTSSMEVSEISVGDNRAEHTIVMIVVLYKIYDLLNEYNAHLMHTYYIFYMQ